jgi:hypothetical protein
VPLPERCAFLLLLCAAVLEEMLVQAAVGHVLVDEECLTFVVGPA